LLLGRTARGRFLFGSLPAPVLHFALVEFHGRIVAGLARESTSALTAIPLNRAPRPVWACLGAHYIGKLIDKCKQGG
jgi:hypothetical protein